MNCDLTIFEGCDGTGKTHLARAYAEATGARYVHHGPYPDLFGHALAAVYADSFSPASSGVDPVVLDRSWLSEPIYGAVHRGGRNRLAGGLRELIEREAARCSALVIVMTVPPEVVLAGFRARRGAEMLDDEAKLLAVQAAYVYGVHTSLPNVRFIAWDLDGDRWRDVAGLVRDVNMFRYSLASAPLEGVAR